MPVTCTRVNMPLASRNIGSQLRKIEEKWVKRENQINQERESHGLGLYIGHTDCLQPIPRVKSTVRQQKLVCVFSFLFKFSYFPPLLIPASWIPFLSSSVFQKLIKKKISGFDFLDLELERNSQQTPEGRFLFF